MSEPIRIKFLRYRPPVIHGQTDKTSNNSNDPIAKVVLNQKTKIRNVKTLTQSRIPEELAYQHSYVTGPREKRNVAEIIKDATTRSPRSVERAKRSFKNPRTSSTRYCRPIRLRFIKQTPESIRDEFQFTENQIRLLEPTKVCVENIEYLETRVLIKTMVDGKVCNSLVHNPSAQICYICGASLKQMKNLQNVVKRKVQKITFNLGVSTLHVQIRFLECLLHKSYRLRIKKWQVRGSEVEVNEFRGRKKQITDRFRSEMGLLFDIRKGRGTTNGNTSRCFFENPKKSGKISGVDGRLIHSWSVILKALSCGYDIEYMRLKQLKSFSKSANRDASSRNLACGQQSDILQLSSHSANCHAHIVRKCNFMAIPAAYFANCRNTRQQNGATCQQHGGKPFADQCPSKSERRHTSKEPPPRRFASILFIYSVMLVYTLADWPRETMESRFVADWLLYAAKGPPLAALQDDEEESSRVMSLVRGFSRGSPISPALSFRRCSILTSITLIGSRDFVVKSRPNIFTHFHSHPPVSNLNDYNNSIYPLFCTFFLQIGVYVTSLVNNGGGTEVPRENPPASTIVRHVSHVQKSGANPLGIDLILPSSDAKSTLQLQFCGPGFDVELLTRCFNIQKTNPSGLKYNTDNNRQNTKVQDKNREHLRILQNNRAKERRQERNVHGRKVLAMEQAEGHYNRITLRPNELRIKCERKYASSGDNGRVHKPAVALLAECDSKSELLLETWEIREFSILQATLHGRHRAIMYISTAHWLFAPTAEMRRLGAVSNNEWTNEKENSILNLRKIIKESRANFRHAFSPLATCFFCVDGLHLARGIVTSLTEGRWNGLGLWLKKRVGGGGGVAALLSASREGTAESSAREPGTVISGERQVAGTSLGGNGAQLVGAREIRRGRPRL
ncbi:hypothetical protein PR048_028894 [Dryococelus australis]|uniref:Ribosomal protein S3 n=1 Tax=Dryococelus australis TaxID=614101 RepID=A0ABQ9GBU8_9NEOP|nr:hypothetical protein PR048_028894 [Dryococelus australis]